MEAESNTLDIRPIPVGVHEIARNSRLVLILSFSLAVFEETLLSTAYGTFRADWPLKLSLASLMIGTFAGIAVLLKQPFGEERQSSLNDNVHRGLNLFYGAQLGGFVIGLVISGAAFIFSEPITNGVFVR